MEAVFFRLHERTVETVTRLFAPKLRTLIEYSFLCAALTSLGSLIHLHLGHADIEDNCLRRSVEASAYVSDQLQILQINVGHCAASVPSERSCVGRHSRWDPIAAAASEDVTECAFVGDASATVGGNVSATEGKESEGEKSIRFWTNHQFTEKSSNSASKGWKSVFDLFSMGDGQLTGSSDGSMGGAACKRYLYSKDKGLILLRSDTKAELGIVVSAINVSLYDCTSSKLREFILEHINGYDAAVLQWLNSIFRHEGFLYNLSTKELIKLNQDPEAVVKPMAWQHYIYQKVGILFTTIFLFFITTTLVSFTLRETQERMLRFTYMLHHHIRNRIPYSLLVVTHVVESLVFVPIMVGMLFFLFQFFSDQLLAFFVLSVVWMCEVYSVMSVRTTLSLKYFPRIVFLYFSAFHIYFFSFPFGYSYLALITTILFLQHCMIYFWNRSEIPALLTRQVTINRPRMTGILFIRNASLATSPLRGGEIHGFHVVSAETDSRSSRRPIGEVERESELAAVRRRFHRTSVDRTDSTRSDPSQSPTEVVGRGRDGSIRGSRDQPSEETKRRSSEEDDQSTLLQFRTIFDSSSSSSSDAEDADKSAENS